MSIDRRAPGRRPRRGSRALAARFLAPARLVAPALVLVLAAGCSDDDDPNAPEPTPPSGVMPDFSLTDVNPSSASYSQQVSPRDYEGKISAYYFGSAT